MLIRARPLSRRMRHDPRDCVNSGGTTSPLVLSIRRGAFCFQVQEVMMCQIMYLASDEPIPLTADQWGEDFVFGIRITPSPERDRVRSKFSKPLIHWVDAWTGCGCGFMRKLYPDEQHKTARSYSALSDYLAEVTRSSSVELYTCYAGSEGEPIEERSRINPHDLTQSDFVFKDRQFLTVERIR